MHWVINLVLININDIIIYPIIIIIEINRESIRTNPSINWLSRIAPQHPTKPTSEMNVPTPISKYAPSVWNPQPLESARNRRQTSLDSADDCCVWITPLGSIEIQMPTARTVQPSSCASRARATTNNIIGMSRARHYRLQFEHDKNQPPRSNRKTQKSYPLQWFKTAQYQYD